MEALRESHTAEVIIIAIMLVGLGVGSVVYYEQQGRAEGPPLPPPLIRHCKRQTNSLRSEVTGLEGMLEDSLAPPWLGV